MLKTLIGILLILLTIHVGYQVGSPVIRNKMLEGKMRDLVDNRGLMGERDLLREVMAFAREKNIPLNESNVYVVVSNDRVSISARYSETATVWFYSKDYDFYPASDPRYRLAPQRRSSRAGMGG